MFSLADRSASRMTMVRTPGQECLFVAVGSESTRDNTFRHAPCRMITKNIPLFVQSLRDSGIDRALFDFNG